MVRALLRLATLAVISALTVYGLRWMLSPTRDPGAPGLRPAHGPPTWPLAEQATGRAPEGVANAPAPTATPSDASHEAGEPDAPARSVPDVLVGGHRPPIVPPEEDVLALDNASLWRLGTSGDPRVGIPRRVAALEALLNRPLRREERVEALSSLGLALRGLQVPTQARQVETLRELIDLAGLNSAMGQRATVQLAWPLWELGRREEAYRLVQDLSDSPRASALDRGLAHWAAMVFCIGLDRLPDAEAHFQQLVAIRESRLVSTVQLARQRIAAARSAARRR